MSAIRLDNELRTYYLRKVEEGKNNMSVLNAIRNKIIHRIFALIKNENFYQKDFSCRRNRTDVFNNYTQGFMSLFSLFMYKKKKTEL
jgi:hypothetical protein